MAIIETAATPSQQLREMAAWVAAHADELVPHGGVCITEDGIDLDVTMHLRSPRECIPTVTVSGRAEVFAVDLSVRGEGGAR